MISQAKTLSCVLLCFYGFALSAPAYSAIVSLPPACDSDGNETRSCSVVSRKTASLEPRKRSVAASVDTSLVRIPSKMDNLYRYNVNSESDIVTFRNKSRNTVQQALTFYNAERHLSIMVRDFPLGHWGRPVDIHRHIGNDELEYDSHNATGLGIASDGTLFVSGNQHVDPLRMAITTRPYDITSFKRSPANAINANDDDRVTYPAFAYLGDELYFFIVSRKRGAASLLSGGY